MLHTGGKLAEHGAGDVCGGLCDEKDAHALGADQADGQLDLVKQFLGAVLKQQVRLIKEEHDARQRAVALLGQQLIQFAQHPHHKSGVQRRAQKELVCGQDVDHAVAGLVCDKPIVDIERGLREEVIAALVFQHRDGALDGAHRALGDVAIAQGVVLRILAHIDEHGTQVLEVNEQHILLVCDAEDQVQNPCLGIVELQHATQQQRAHLGHGGAHGVARLAKDIPEHHRAGARREVLHAADRQAGIDLLVELAGLGQAAQIALDIRHEHGHAQLAESLRHHLQGDGLARAGGPGDQAVAVGHLGQHANRAFLGSPYPYLVFQQHVIVLL